MGRWRTALAGVLVLALLGLTAPAASAVSDRDRARVVRGSDGYLFIAQDWTVACQDRGQERRVAAAVRELATALRRSGRRVVVTVGPDKSTPLRRHVPRAFPGKTCGDESRRRVWEALRRDGGPGFLDLRPALQQASAGPAQTYWRKDTHWTPTGGLVFARELARRLDPALAGRLGSHAAVHQRDGDLARVLGEPESETVLGQQLVNPGVRSVELLPEDVGAERRARRTLSTGAPGARLVEGRTLVLGDSFTGTAVEQLAPLFRDARYLFPGYQGAPLAPVLAQVEQADTVVIEVVERFVQRYRLFEPDAVAAFRRLPRR